MASTTENRARASGALAGAKKGHTMAISAITKATKLMSFQPLFWRSSNSNRSTTVCNSAFMIPSLGVAAM